MSGRECDFVVVSGSGIDGVSFPDLYYKTPTGPRVVRHMPGQRIETKNIDPDILASSLRSGSLFRAIKGRVVEVREIGHKPEVVIKPEDPKVEPPKDAYPTRQTNGAEATKEFMKGIKVEAPVLHTIIGGTVYGEPKDQRGPEYVEVKYGATEASIPKTPEASVAKVETVDPLQEFKDLQWMDKLKFIKRCEDVAKLELIVSDIDSTQLKNNASRRIKALKEKK